MAYRLGRHFLLALVATVVISVGGTSSARAEEVLLYPDTQYVPHAPAGIAMIDLGDVFKNSRKFQRDMEQMKRDLEEREAYYRKKMLEVNELVEQLDELDFGSEEYRRLEEDIEKLRYGVMESMSFRNKDFILAESRIYFDAYQSIIDAIREYAEAHQIGLVLRFRREPMDRHNANSVMKGVNSKVIYHTLPDITDEIIRRLNEQDLAAVTTAR